MTHLDSVFEVHDSIDDVIAAARTPLVPAPRGEAATEPA
jgi:hypothetical protein